MPDDKDVKLHGRIDGIEFQMRTVSHISKIATLVFIIVGLSLSASYSGPIHDDRGVLNTGLTCLVLAGIALILIMLAKAVKVMLFLGRHLLLHHDQLTTIFIQIADASKDELDRRRRRHG